MKKIAPVSILLILVLFGCATTGGGFNVIQSRIDAVQIGMTKDQVKSLLGPPWTINTQVMAEGTLEQWVYTGDTLITNLLPPGEQFAMGMMVGLRGGSLNGMMTVTFANGLVRLITK